MGESFTALDAGELTTAIRQANRMNRVSPSETGRIGCLRLDSRMWRLCELAAERYRTTTVRERDKDSTFKFARRLWAGLKGKSRPGPARYGSGFPTGLAQLADDRYRTTRGSERDKDSIFQIRQSIPLPVCIKP